MSTDVANFTRRVDVKGIRRRLHSTNHGTISIAECFVKFRHIVWYDERRQGIGKINIDGSYTNRLWEDPTGFVSATARSAARVPG